MSANLNLKKALIFRIVHRDNLPWILDHGLHCRNSATFDPHYRNIGHPELIQKRHSRVVPIAPGGVLSDYIPFYFTPYSVMLFNISTGWGGMPKIPKEDIIILVSSLRRLVEKGVTFVFTDQHAYPVSARYFNDLDRLDQIDWPILQNRDFKHDPDDPGKKERYQAEALIHQHLPIDCLLGISSYNPQVASWLQGELENRGIDLRILTRPTWFF